MRNITAITGPWSDVPPIVDVTDQLPNRGTWEGYAKQKIVRGVYYWKDGTTTEHWVKGKAPLYLPSGFRPGVTGEEIDTIVIHHTASNAPLENQAKYHISHHEWPRIAYHIVIDQGQIKQTNNLLSMTFHAGGNNTYTVGICVNADLSKREMTDQERELLYVAILTVKSLLPIKHIVGHREVPGAATACPCTSMDRIRGDIAALEAKMQQGESWEAKMKKAGEVLEVMKYWKSLIKEKDSGKPNAKENAAWGLANYTRTYDFLKQNGLV